MQLRWPSPPQLVFLRAWVQAIKADPELEHHTCFVDSHGADVLDRAMIDLK
jgi:hypothetical protein